MMAKFKLCKSANINPIDPYDKSIRQQNPDDDILQKDISLSVLVIQASNINTSSWFDVIENLLELRCTSGCQDTLTEFSEIN